MCLTLLIGWGMLCWKPLRICWAWWTIPFLSSPLCSFTKRNCFSSREREGGTEGGKKGGSDREEDFFFFFAWPGMSTPPQFHPCPTARLDCCWYGNASLHQPNRERWGKIIIHLHLTNGKQSPRGWDFLQEFRYGCVLIMFFTVSTIPASPRNQGAAITELNL